MRLGRTNGRNNRLLLRTLQGRICIQILQLCEQNPKRGDVNLHVQEGNKEVGERENTNKTRREEGSLGPKSKC